MKLRKMLGLGYKETLFTAERGKMKLKMVRRVFGTASEIKLSVSKEASKFSKLTKLGKPKPMAVIPLEDFMQFDSLMIDALKFLREDARKHLR